MIRGIVFLLFFLVLYRTSSMTCLDENGVRVAWFVSINYPTTVQQGQNYYFGYYDSKTTIEDFEQKDYEIDSEKSPLTRTLEQINSRTTDTIAWNDDQPGSQTGSSYKAHAKAVITIDAESKKGFYLGHSMPNYPAFDRSGKVNPTITATAKIYGQSIICMSLNLDSIEQLANKFLITKPNIYFHKISSQITPNLKRLAANPRLSRYSPSNYTTTLRMELGNEPLEVFIKSKKGDFFIFEHMMVPKLQTSLYTETWGRPIQDAMCKINNSTFFTKNIEEIEITPTIKWSYTQDHSKWAVSTKKDKPYVCIGDQNRMTSQNNRGGSFFCIKKLGLWKAFYLAVEKVSECPKECTPIK